MEIFNFYLQQVEDEPPILEQLLDSLSIVHVCHGHPTMILDGLWPYVMIYFPCYNQLLGHE